MRCTQRRVCSFWHAAAGGAAFPGWLRAVCVMGHVWSKAGMLAHACAVHFAWQSATSPLGTRSHITGMFGAENHFPPVAAIPRMVDPAPSLC